MVRLRRLWSASFRPTFRQAGVKRRRYPRWRTLQAYGSLVYRLAYRRKAGNAPYRIFRRSQRLGERRFGSWARYARGRWLLDGPEDRALPLPLWGNWQNSGEHTLGADAVGDYYEPEHETLDPDRIHWNRGHFAPLDRRLRQVHRGANFAVRPTLRRQLVPAPLSMRLLTRARTRRVVQRRRPLQGSWNHLLMRGRGETLLMTRLGRVGLQHFYGGIRRGGTSVQKYLRRATHRRTPLVRQLWWKRTFDRFHSSKQLRARWERLNVMSTMYLGGYLFRSGDGFHLSPAAQRSWYRGIYTPINALWAMEARRAVDGPRWKRLQEAEELEQRILALCRAQGWDSRSTLVQLLRQSLRRRLRQEKTARAYDATKWANFLGENGQTVAFRRRLGILFHRQRRRLYRFLANLARGLALLGRQRRRLDWMIRGNVPRSRRRTLARRLGTTGRRLRSLAGRRLPLIFQQLPRLSRSNHSLGELLWDSLGRSEAKDQLATGSHPLGLGRERSRFGGGFFGHLGTLAGQTPARERLEALERSWTNVHRTPLGEGAPATPAALAGADLVGPTAAGVAGDRSPLALRLQSRLNRALVLDRSQLRSRPLLHSAGELALRCKGERLLNAFLSQQLNPMDQNYAHLSVMADFRTRRPLSHEQKKFFREIRRDSRLRLPRAKRLGRPRRVRRGRPPRRTREMQFHTHWAIYPVARQLRRTRAARFFPRRRQLGRVNIRDFARICRRKPRHNLVRPFGLDHRSAYRLRRRRRRENFAWRTISQITLGLRFWIAQGNLRRQLKARRRRLHGRRRRVRLFRYRSPVPLRMHGNRRGGHTTAQLLQRRALFGEWRRLLRGRQQQLSLQRSLRVKTPIWYQNIKTRSSRDVRINLAKGLISYSKRTRKVLGVCKGIRGRRRRLRRRRQLRRPLLRWLGWRAGNPATTFAGLDGPWNRRFRSGEIQPGNYPPLDALGR